MSDHPELPKPRGITGQIVVIVITIVFFMAAVLTHSTLRGALKNSLVSVCVYSCITILLIIFWEFVTRFGEFLEEVKHHASRYDHDWSKLLSSVFLFNKSTTILLVLAFFLLLLGIIYKRGFNFDFEVLPVAFSLLGSLCLYKLLGIDNSDLRTILSLTRSHGLDYGSGIAFSFYYGYLNIILPKTGDANKGIIERINDYMGKEEIREGQFPVKKLFILIPTSGFIPTTFSSEDKIIQVAKPLESQIRDRAGVSQRVYKNTVYKIQISSSYLPSQVGDYKSIYVVAEGATPLKTLHEVINFGGVKGGIYGKYRQDIIFNFYSTLKDIIKSNEDTRHTCELIYYVDTDENGEPVNIAELILNRILDLRNISTF